MVRCWNINPDFRPSFEKLRQRMESYIGDTVCNQGLIEKLSNLICPSIDFVQSLFLLYSLR